MDYLNQLKSEFGKFLWRIGVSANFITCSGLIVAALAGILISLGGLATGAYLLIIAGVLDLLDGAIARASNGNNKFGAILDSTFDRYGDGFALGGLLFFCATNGRMFYAALAFSAILGSFAVSYVRARSECIVDKCRVGYWERGERIVFISIGLFMKNPAMVLWVLAIGPHWTAFQRLLYSALKLKGVSSNSKQVFIDYLARPHTRNQIIYFIKGILLFLLLLYKPVF